MKSPFAIFRKYQKELMVVLTGLAMFSFVVMDSIRSDSSGGATLPILCGVAGMALLGFVGWRRGEAVTFGAVGIAIGVVVGVFLMRYTATGPKAPIETDVGNLSHEELNNLMTRRNNANSFIRVAFEKLNPPMESNPMLHQYWEQQLSERMFGFGRGREDMTEDVLLGYLLDKEADELGIAINDEAISDYINRITANRLTGKKLTQKEFSDALKAVHLSEFDVFSAIRGELRAKLAMELLLPRVMTTPEQYWDEYRRLGVTATLDVAAIPVADFLADAPQPSQDDLVRYFDQWKQVPQAFPGGPGLRQPRRWKVEYFQADFAQAEKEVAAKGPVTDQEIKKYYEDHKEEFRNRPAAGSSTMPPLSTAPGSNTFGPSLTVPPAPSNPAGGGAAPKTGSGAGAGAGAGKTLPGRPNLTPQGKEAPKRNVAPPPPPKNAAPQKGTNKETGKSGAWNDRSPDRANRFKPELLAEVGSGRMTMQLAAAAYQADPKGGQAVIEPSPPPMPQRPVGKTPSGTKPAATAPGAPAKPEPEFKPLDDNLKREIGEQILRSRAQQRMKEQIQDAYDFMTSLREKLIPAEIGAAPAMDDKAREAKLTQYAAQHHLKYVLTPLLSAQELHDSVEKYPIGGAAEPVDDPFAQRAPVEVIQQLFITSPELLFQPYLAEDRESQRFAYWKVADVADHVPTLEEPGVKQEATRGWQIENYGQKKAKERADALADLARKSKQTMAEALAGQKVNKKAKGGGPAVVVVPTPAFSWYTVQSTAPRDLMPDSRPRLSDIVGVSDPDETFMKAIFDEMQVGDVRVVPNRGSLIFYVVKEKTRHPSDAAEKEAFRARFMRERFFGSGFFMGGQTTYDYLNMPQQQYLVQGWVDQLFTKYRVRRNFEEERRPRSRRAG